MAAAHLAHHHISGISTTPSLAIAPDGTVFAAWPDESSGNAEIYVRRR